MDVKPFMVHNMGRVGSGTIYASLLEADYKAGHVHSLFKPRSERGREAVKMVKRARRDVYVITPVRDPVSRNLSSFYLNHCARQHRPAAGIRDFLAFYKHDTPVRWFNEEFIPFWGVDVYAEPFDLERGWKVYGGYILIIRAADLDREWSGAFRALTGLDAPPLVYDNVQNDAEYTKFLSQQIPREYTQQMQETKYYRHFYGENRGE